MAGRRGAQAGAAALLATGLLLVGAPPASAHTDDLFIWAFDGTPMYDNGGFATVSKTDAAMTLLEPLPGESLGVLGAEICGENGYAVGWDNDADEPVSITWNHDTGALGTPVPLTVDWDEPWDGEEVLGAEINDVGELDTLADCTVLGIVSYRLQVAGQLGFDVEAVATFDPVSGETVPILLSRYSPDDPEVDFDSLATDPVTGTTYLYLFLSQDDNAAVAELDPIAGTLSAPEALSGIAGYFDSNVAVRSADFDESGLLWAVIAVNAEEEYHLVSLVGPSTDLPSTVPTDLGILPYYTNESGLQVNPPTSLTVDPAAVEPDADPAPSLAETGSDSGGALAGIVLLLSGGAMLIAVSRRRRSSAT